MNFKIRVNISYGNIIPPKSKNDLEVRRLEEKQLEGKIVEKNNSPSIVSNGTGRVNILKDIAKVLHEDDRISKNMNEKLLDVRAGNDGKI